ncbi:hypothetical protein [Sorangium sp. So ce542]|uniref:hypothetical protein n=1 Tax=Sorangium sp. So ce542 TaxID=3133316 RepID=UPI003F5F13CE
MLDFIHYPTSTRWSASSAGVAGGAVRGPLGGSLRRGILDPARRTLRLEERLPLPVDMPRVSPQVDARPHRYIYLTGYSAALRRAAGQGLLRSSGAVGFHGAWMPTERRG